MALGGKVAYIGHAQPADANNKDEWPMLLLARGRQFVLGAAVGIAVSGAIVAAMRARPTSGTVTVRTPLGDTLPDVSLFDIDGKPVRLKERLRGRGGVVYVFGPQHCAGCANLGMEFR